MAIFLILSDPEYEALITVLKGYRDGLEIVRPTVGYNRIKQLDAEFKLVFDIEQKLKKAK
jgi:hypothetical protein